MKKLVLALTTLLCTLCAEANDDVNLDSLYAVLDAAIDSADIYLQQKQGRIASLKDNLRLAGTDEERLQSATKVYQEYVPFNNDSAIAYQYQCVNMAAGIGREDLKAEATAALAYQLANSGFYHEARIHFNEIPREYLKDALLNRYLSGMNHLYGEMGYYSHDPKLSQEFHHRANELRDSLMALTDSTSSQWVALRSMVLRNTGQPNEALPYSDKWKASAKPGSRRYAIMAFYRSEIYKDLGNVQMQRYWLIQSAIIDVRNAIMDQGSLWSLANSLIRDDGDLDRAYRYMDFSWQCISRFSPHMRAWQVAPILTNINNQYREQLQTANMRLRWTLALISLLAIGLLLLVISVSKKRRQLATARNELRQSNERLMEANSQLTEFNSQLSDLNAHLTDSNRVKEEYISKFLQLCSDYINKLDNYRIKINRKMKAGQTDEVRKLTSSTQMKEDEERELYDNFDAVFLHLFPDFVSEFNALLRPEERIELPEENRLTTDLRIFALIRLGIDESSRIAEFLRYSPNSIYNYRARIKKKAIGSREDFEKQVKEIGIRKAHAHAHAFPTKSN